MLMHNSVYPILWCHLCFLYRTLLEEPCVPSLLSSCTLLEQEMDLSFPPICAILAFILYPARAGDGHLSLPYVPSWLSTCTCQSMRWTCLSLPSVQSLLSSCTLLEQEMDLSFPPMCAILPFILYPARAGDGLVSLSHVCHPCFHLVPC